MGQRASIVRREDLAARRGADIVRGSRTKADLWIAALADGTPVVVKDFAAKGAFVRLWGRLQIAREVRFLRLLADLREVPRLVARLDAHALVLEKLAGTPLFHFPVGPVCRPYLLELRRVLDLVQARGIVHLDLRGRENVMIAAADRVVVLDWAGALRLPPGTLRHRVLFGPLKAIDDSAYLKWKDMQDPESLSANEREFLRRFRRWRRLWPFNRKGVGWTRTDP